MGSFNMFEALATLAYDGPRADFARHELLAALKMVQQEHLDPKQMTSSWAGAFGQTQFVPSSFLIMPSMAMATASAICGTRPPMRWPPAAECAERCRMAARQCLGL